MIRAILLVPAEGDPYGLLAPGVCGAMVPTAYEWPADGWIGLDRLRRRRIQAWPGADEEDGWTLTGEEAAIARGYRCALVLAWDAEPVVEGCDRAHRALNRWRRAQGRYAVLAPLDTYDIDDALGIAHDCAARLGGEVVVVEGGAK